MRDEDGDARQYDVVMNHEEQYSIWLTGKEIPEGWTAVGKSGSKAECLQYIEEVWTDMRPLSLRKHMDAIGREVPVDIPRSAENVPTTTLTARPSDSTVRTTPMLP